ncbi:MAG: hypothetical protein C6P37_16215 [Caldibacillus debilis]|uniref:Uncharacterized protein n=1 Tax=Caldibacillus debilis TaxID=301148 RepID=A0A3E0JW98_9BACI|nr:MAG: hypothetical protein C6P37_16215 [Caldibacillus debilis]
MIFPAFSESGRSFKRGSNADRLLPLILPAVLSRPEEKRPGLPVHFHPFRRARRMAIKFAAGWEGRLHGSHPPPVPGFRRHDGFSFSGPSFPWAGSAGFIFRLKDPFSRNPLRNIRLLKVERGICHG